MASHITSLDVIANLHTEMYFTYNTNQIKFPKKIFKVSQMLKARGSAFL